MKARTERLLTAPAVVVSLLPKALCPICAPVYSAILSSLGLGFIATTYLLPVTIGFFAIALAALGFRASSRRGLGPLGVGLVASACVLVGKFWLGSDCAVCVGVALLIVAAVWNAIPRRGTPEACHACLQIATGPETE